MKALAYCSMEKPWLLLQLRTWRSCPQICNVTVCVSVWQCVTVCERPNTFCTITGDQWPGGPCGPEKHHPIWHKLLGRACLCNSVSAWPRHLCSKWTCTLAIVPVLCV